MDSLGPLIPVDKSGIGVLDKSIAILTALEGRSANLADLVERTGVPRATCHRLAVALEQHGFLRRQSDGRFSLGLRLVSLASAVGESRLAERAQPVLDELRNSTEESAQLYVFDGDQRLCVAVAESPHELRTIVTVGERLSMELGSAATVLRGTHRLAGSIGERQAGVASVSAAVLAGNNVVAAISVSGPIERLGPDPAARFGDDVAAAAEALRVP